MSFCFQSRVVLSGFVTIKPGARLVFNGASKGPRADLSLVKDMSGMPYIPGSTFKRLLRSHAQDVLNYGGHHNDCDPYDNQLSCIRMGIPGTTDGVYLKSLLDDCIWSDEQLKEAIERHTCMLCTTFGSQLLESKIAIEDLRPESWQAQFRQKPVGKDRDLLDLISEDRRFVFRAVLEDCDLWQRGMVMAAGVRAQTRLLTVAAGAGKARAIATFELTDVRALESPREYLEAINSRSVRDGHLVESASWEAWIASFYARLRERFPTHVAG